MELLNGRIEFKFYYEADSILRLGTVALIYNDRKIKCSGVDFTQNNILSFCRPTTMKDKSGQEVYEGDLFRFSEGVIGVVKFGEYYNTIIEREQGGHVGFYVDFDVDDMRKDLNYWCKNYSKIGNIQQLNKIKTVDSDTEQK